MFEFEKIKQGAVLTRYIGNEDVVVIPQEFYGEPVISIENAVFFNNTKIKEVLLPKTLTKLNCSTFCGCESLEKIEFPEGLEEIGRECFYDCKSLKELIFPKSLLKIHVQCFSGCTNLKKVISLNKNMIIGELAFDNIETIEEVNVNLLYALDFELDLQVKFAKKLLIESDFDDEFIDLFSVKNNLKFMLLYSDNINIFAKVLAVSPMLTLYDINIYLEYHIINENTSITASLLDYRDTNFSKEVIEADKERSELVEIGLEKPSLIEFSRSWNYSMTDGEITILGYRGRSRHEVIPISLRDGIKIVKIRKAEADIAEYEDFLMTTFFIENQNFCNLSSLTIEARITTIEANIFCKNNKLEKIVLPDSITNIEAGAFEYCSCLQEFTLPYNVSVIYPNTFRGCKKLAEINLHENLKIISKNSFESVRSIKEIIIPASVRLIEKEAFMGCVLLRKILFLGEIPKLEENVFKFTPLEKELKERGVI